MRACIFKTAIAFALMGFLLTSCNMAGSKPVTDNFVGDTAGELQGKIIEILDHAGTDTTKAEFIEIMSFFNYQKPDNNIASISVQLVSSSNKDKMEQYAWTDMQDRRDYYEQFDVVVTDTDNCVIDNYEGFAERLFTYADISKYIDNLPTYCIEAIKASGYGEKGYIKSFFVNCERKYIVVGNKDSNSVSIMYNIKKDGSGIVL